jgi:SAM-dependent methyltransferase
MIRRILKLPPLKRLIAAFDMPRARARLLEDPALSTEQKELLRAVPLNISGGDTMYVPFNGIHYLRVGLSAVKCLRAARNAAPSAVEPNAILDLPCGHGRVLRFLKMLFPQAKLAAMEIDRSAIAYCAAAFGAEALASTPDFDAIRLPAKYDLIWSGSLVTHLTEEGTAKLCRFAHRHLNPGGMFLFTSHGNYSVGLLRNRISSYGLDPSVQAALLAQYDECAYGFGRYPGGGEHYGISLSTREKIRELALAAGNWNEVFFAEKFWDDHQDLHAYLRPAARANPL